MTAPTPSNTPSSRLIPATNLNPADFASFGQVIQNPATHDGQPDLRHALANQGSATKWLDVTGMLNHYPLARSKKAAKVSMNMFVCKPRALKQRQGKEVFPVEILERHPFTPQTFVPLGLSAEDRMTYYLVIVAPTLPNRSWGERDDRQPPYPIPEPRARRSLKDRLLGARPNLFTNDYTPSTTPTNSASPPGPKGSGPPDLANLRAFVARGDQAVTYGPGTWHAPMVALGERAIEFVVVQYANGVAEEDCQEHEIEGREAMAVDLSRGEELLKAKL